MMTPITSFMAAVLVACLLLAGVQPTYAQALSLIHISEPTRPY